MDSDAVFREEVTVLETELRQLMELATVTDEQRAELRKRLRQLKVRLAERPS